MTATRQDLAARPAIIRRAASAMREVRKRCEHVLAYRLRQARLHDGSLRERLMYQQRFQACLAVFDCLLQHMDVVTNVIGVDLLNGSIKGMLVTTIAEKTGLQERRVERCIRDLRNVGFIESWQRSEKTHQGVRARAAIRQIPAQLFDLIGLGGALAAAAAKAWAKRKKKSCLKSGSLAALNAVSHRNQARTEKRAAGALARSLRDFLPDYSPG